MRGLRLRPLPLRLGLVACALVLVICAGLWWTGRSDGRVHLLFPALPGDGILVKGPHGEIAVVDGGADGAAFASWLGRHLPLGKRRIDLLLSTRADPTTLPGQLAAVRRYSVGRAVLVRPLEPSAQWNELVRGLEQQGTPIHIAEAGDQIMLGGPAHPMQARMTILATPDGQSLLELRAGASRILLLQSSGKGALPAALGHDPTTVLLYPWSRRADDPVLQRLRPEVIIFGEQPGDDPHQTLAERRIGAARLLHETLDGEIELQIDASGTRIATRAP